MARAQRILSPARLLALAAFGLLSFESVALAQQGGKAPQASGAQGAKPGAQNVSRGVPAKIELKAPSPFRVYQRDENDKADIPIVLADFDKQGSPLQFATLAPIDANAKITFNQAESKLVGVPVGGPYTITCQFKCEDQLTVLQVGNVYVGDLWVLAGQSNMEG